MTERPPLFAELCCGSAAVTLRLLGGPSAKPPVSYMGSKRGYAEAILAVLGLRAGVGADAVLLCDPGPWSRVWRVLCRPGGPEAVAAIIRGWIGEEPRALWERLRAQRPLEGEAGAAQYVMLAASNRLINVDWNDGVATNTGNRRAVAGHRSWANTGVGGTTFGGDEFATPAADVAEALGALAAIRWPDGTVIGTDARVSVEEVAAWLWLGAAAYRPGQPASGLYTRVNGAPQVSTGEVAHATGVTLGVWPPSAISTDARAPIPAALPPGCVVYIDPPYANTTPYAHDLPRADVLEIARRWSDAGALVAVSEAEPLPLPGWYEVELTAERIGQKRTFSKQQREFLTMNRSSAVRIGGQVGMFG